MFGNKGYLWKLGAALALIAVLGVHADRMGESINPPLWRCVVEPGRWDNTVLWLPYARVVSIRDGEFEIAATDARIRVTGKPPVGVGDRLTLRGTFRADGPRIELIESRPLPADLDRRRLLMEVVSVLVVLVVLANFLRHFRVRPKVLQVEGVD